MPSPGNFPSDAGKEDNLFYPIGTICEIVEVDEYDGETVYRIVSSEDIPFSHKYSGWLYKECNIQGYFNTMGFIRYFDDLGRVCIPFEIREKLYNSQNVSGKPIEIIYNEDGSITLKPI